MFKNGAEYNIQPKRGPSITYQGKSAMEWARIFNTMGGSHKNITHIVRQHIKKYGHLENLKNDLKKYKHQNCRYKDKKISYWVNHYNVHQRTIHRHLESIGKNTNKTTRVLKQLKIEQANIIYMNKK